MTRRRLAAPAIPVFDVAGAVDDLRQFIARADALALATEDLLEHGPWGGSEDQDEDALRLDRLSHLLGATVEAVRAARVAGDHLAAELARRGVAA